MKNESQRENLKTKLDGEDDHKHRFCGLEFDGEVGLVTVGEMLLQCHDNTRGDYSDEDRVLERSRYTRVKEISATSFGIHYGDKMRDEKICILKDSLNSLQDIARFKEILKK